MANEKPTSRGGSPEMGPTASLAAGFLVGGGRFSLLRELARGGMGVVWLAHDERLAGPVALKFLSDSVRNNSAALGDLRHETQRCRMLSHPNIIRIYDLYEAVGEDAFISMEYVEGSNLWTLRGQEKYECFSWEYLKPIVRQLCDALEYAHSEGVIHRDLKPGNMLVDERKRLRLADFGLATKIYGTLSDGPAHLRSSGTASYMSPQQIDGKPATVSDDIYALGASLYELLIGHPPFYENDVLHQVKNTLPIPLQDRMQERNISHHLPAGVAAMIMSCLAKDPRKRPRSARAVSDWVGLTGLAASIQALKPTITPAPMPVESTPDTEIIRREAMEKNEQRRKLVLLAGAVGLGAMAWLAWTHLLPKAPAASSVAMAPLTTNITSNVVVPIPTTAASASVELGQTGHEKGLKMLSLVEGGEITPAEVAGKNCILLRLDERERPRGRCYFQVVPEFRPSAPVHARIKVEYYATTPGVLQLLFDGTTHYRNAGRKEFSGTGKWESAYYELDDASFHGEERGGADFCLNTSCPQLCIHSIELFIDN